MTKVRLGDKTGLDHLLIYIDDRNVSHRTGRCKATIFFCQSRSGGGDLPVPLGPGGGGGEEGEEHRADREDCPRGVWSLPSPDHRLCRKGQKELTDCEDIAWPSYNIAKLYLFAFVPVRCLYKIYL